jgi:glycosyltransferase involved in cell wall biosynthesis
MAEKIIQVVTQMEAGGAQRVALLLHRELRRRGLDAELWFLYQQTPAYADEPGVVALWPRRPKLLEVAGLLKNLVANVRRTRPSVMIAHTHYANVMALPIAKVCGVKSRLAVHHNAISTYPAAARRLELWWKRLGVYSESIVVSEDVRGSLLRWRPKLYAGSTRCIYNGLDERGGEPQGVIAGELLRKISGNDVLFNVGRLTAQKNQRAIVRVLAEMPECVAVIAGRGPLQESLRREAREAGVESRLHLLGEVSSDMVAKWMRRADVFVFPSQFEAMPMALLEAMHAGMAIVASDIPAHREVAGDCALLSETAPVPLAMTIRSALEQRKHGNPLGDAARQRSRRFTVQAMANAYLEAM